MRITAPLTEQHPAPLAPLRPACTCAAGKTCLVCLAYAGKLPKATRPSAHKTLAERRAQFAHDEARLAALLALDPQTAPADWARQKRTLRQRVHRLRKVIEELETIEARGKGRQQ